MAQPVMIDLRNIYRLEDMAAYGFSYESVGRPPGVRN
jgi:UDPglucose 6-dehydrogenase